MGLCTGTFCWVLGCNTGGLGWLVLSSVGNWAEQLPVLFRKGWTGWAQFISSRRSLCSSQQGLRSAPLHHLLPRSLHLPPQPVEHSVRDPLLSPAAAKSCELSWSILERGMLFIFILCIFCLGLLITFVPQERQLPQ